MTQKTDNRDSRLIPILREGVAVIQMIFFKECREMVGTTRPDLNPATTTMLAGAITNEIFGSHNPDEKFRGFYNSHRSLIEQELLNLRNSLPHLNTPLTAALRTQVLCDNQEGSDSSQLLKQAESLGLLMLDQELPLPSVFMEMVRSLGAQHELIIPPVEINSCEEQNLLQ